MKTWRTIKPFNASQINGIQYSSTCVFYLNLNCYQNDETNFLPGNTFTIDFLGIRQTANGTSWSWKLPMSPDKVFLIFRANTYVSFLTICLTFINPHFPPILWKQRHGFHFYFLTEYVKHSVLESQYMNISFIQHTSINLLKYLKFQHTILRFILKRNLTLNVLYMPLLFL